MRRLLPVPLAAFLLLSACGAGTRVTVGDTARSSSVFSVPASASPPASSSTSTSTSTSSSEAPASTVIDGVRVVRLSLDGVTFSPSTLRFKKDEKAAIELHTEEARGMIAPMLRISAITDHKQTTVGVPTAKTGRFEFWCNLGCDGDVRGAIVIEL